MPDSTPAVAVLGCGTMGEALVAGAIAQGLPPGRIRVSARRKDRLTKLRDRYRVAGTTDNVAASAGVPLVVLALPPHPVPEVLGDISGHLSPGTVIACVADGVDLTTIRARLPEHASAVRAMPNLLSRLGHGVTLLSYDPACTPEQRARVTDFFTLCGEVLTVPEEEQPVLAPLSSSGAAYFSYVASAMIDAGVARGIPREQSRRLVTDSVAGVAAWMLAEDSDGDPQILTQRLCSPGGTGARRLAVLDESGVPDAFRRALGS